MSHSIPRRRTLPLFFAAGVLMAACTPPPPPAGGAPSPPPQTVQSPELVSSLRVEAGDTVVLTLQVTNPSAGPVAFTFPSGQTYDFVIRSGGAELWRWSADRGFTQALRTVTVAAGETWTFSERWTPPPGTRGELTAVARLASSDRPVERTAVFRLP